MKTKLRTNIHSFQSAGYLLVCSDCEAFLGGLGKQKEEPERKKRRERNKQRQRSPYVCPDEWWHRAQRDFSPPICPSYYYD